MKKHVLILIESMVVFILALTLVATAAAAARSNILIVPFNIHAQTVQPFLKPAITDMLYTRLSAKDRTVLVQNLEAVTESISVEDAMALGRQQNVDYVLYGSITLLGTLVSTDAQLVDMTLEKPVLTFNEVGQDQGDIITHMEHLTTRINETVFNVAPTVVPPPVSPPPSEAAPDDIRTHPEKLVIPGLTPPAAPAPAPATPPSPSAAPTPPAARATPPKPAPATGDAPPSEPETPAPPAPAMVMTTGRDKDEVLLSFWKSDALSAAIDGISIADVDADGANEIVFIARNQVFVYRHQNGHLQEVETLSHKAFTRLMFVDTADINQNGVPEIFVTDYISSNQRLKSIALEWNGQEFAVIDEMPNWYLRVLKTKAFGTLLLGQKRGTGSSFTFTSPQEALFDRNIHEIKWQDGRYAAAGQFALPQRDMTVFDFTQGDAANNGQLETVAFLRNDYIRIYNPSGEVAWESDELYGGSRLFFEAPDVELTKSTNVVNSSGRKLAKYYLPQRIHITDIDGDGLNEIIVVKNYDGDGGIFSRIKSFKEGRIDCLSYDEIGIQRKWQTRNIAGYISDYVIGDLNNDGTNEIVLSSVAKGKSAFSKGRSYILSVVPKNE